MNIVTFGETMVQYNAKYNGPYRIDGDYLEDCAGAESNFALDLCRLGIDDISAKWVSRLGDDSAGQFILDTLLDEITVIAPKCLGERTGVSYLNHLDNDQHTKTYQRKGSAASKLTFQEIQAHLRGTDLLHVTGITPALSDQCRDSTLRALQHAQSISLPVSFDLNFREQLWDKIDDAIRVFDTMIRTSTIFKLGYDEAEAVWGKGWTPSQYIRHFQKINSGIVILTMGAEGAIVFDGESMISHSGFEVKVIDPVGAGDAFVAGFIAGIIRRYTPRQFMEIDKTERYLILEEAIKIANVCGAITCTKRGDTSAMPTMSEVEQFVLVPKC